MIKGPSLAVMTGAALTVVLFAAGAQAAASAHPTALAHGPSSLAHAELVVKAAPASCAKKAPTSAARYAALFAALPVKEWGAADGSISVKVAARSVWFYGDTFSTGRFLHSTAITQSTAGACTSATAERSCCQTTTPLISTESNRLSLCRPPGSTSALEQ
jgi:hypothetical protein